MSSEEKKSEPESVSSESGSEEDGDPSSYCNSDASASDKYDDSDASDNNNSASELHENKEPPAPPVLKRTEGVKMKSSHKNEQVYRKIGSPIPILWLFISMRLKKNTSISWQKHINILNETRFT